VAHIPLKAAGINAKGVMVPSPQPLLNWQAV